MNLRFSMGLLIVLLLNMQEASAGPLSDKLVERKDQQQNRLLEDDESASGKASLPQGVQLLSNIAYGDDGKQRMDVYLPLQAKDAPVIFMVHGGGWRRGDKTMKTVVENKVARWVPKGFIFISLNYRLLPAANPVQQAEDVSRALAFAQAKASSWGGNPSRFILMGHSAGAHLVALLAASPAKAASLGARPWLGTIALDSAALDVVKIMEKKHLRLYDEAFGGDQTFWKSASPYHVLSTGAAPMLMVCSTKRPDNPCAQAHAFAKKAASLGIRVEVSEQALSHKQINEQLGLSGKYTETTVEAFMNSLGGNRNMSR